MASWAEGPRGQGRHSSALAGGCHVGVKRLGLVGVEHLPLRDTGEQNGRLCACPTTESCVLREASSLVLLLP